MVRKITGIYFSATWGYTAPYPFLLAYVDLSFCFKLFSLDEIECVRPQSFEIIRHGSLSFRTEITTASPSEFITVS